MAISLLVLFAATVPCGNLVCALRPEVSFFSSLVEKHQAPGKSSGELESSAQADKHWETVTADASHADDAQADDKLRASVSDEASFSSSVEHKANASVTVRSAQALKKKITLGQWWGQEVVFRRSAPVTSVNIYIFLFCPLFVLTVALLNSCYNASRSEFKDEVAHWIKPLGLVVVLTWHTSICYMGTYDVHMDENSSFTHAPKWFIGFCVMVHAIWTRVILLGTIALVVAGYFYESLIVQRAPVQHGEIFTADDVYTNATAGMFNLTVRFALQSCLMLILVYVAEEAWANPPHQVPMVRKVWNFVLALALQLYMVGRFKWRSAWHEMRRLRTVRFVRLAGVASKADAPGRDEAQDIIQFRLGDYYVRLAMSVVANGIFHKFLLLSYPIFIFGYIGSADLLGIVKDILAIMIVMEIDDLSSPVQFTAYVDDPRVV